MTYSPEFWPAAFQPQVITSHQERNNIFSATRNQTYDEAAGMTMNMHEACKIHSLAKSTLLWAVWYRISGCTTRLFWWKSSALTTYRHTSTGSLDRWCRCAPFSYAQVTSSQTYRADRLSGHTLHCSRLLQYSRWCFYFLLQINSWQMTPYRYLRNYTCTTLVADDRAALAQTHVLVAINDALKSIPDK